MKLRNQVVKTMCVILVSLGPYLQANHQPLSKLIDSFSQKVGVENSLTFTTSLELGGDRIEQVSLFYSSNKPLELGCARALIVKMTELFLQELNRNAFLKSDLFPYPFTAQQLDITIFFRGANGQYAMMPQIAQIALEKGTVSFYKYHKGLFELVQQESLEEARKPKLAISFPIRFFKMNFSQS